MCFIKHIERVIYYCCCFVNCFWDRIETFWHNCSSIYSKRGIYGFYRGILPSMFGVFQSSLHFMFYEQFKYKIQSKHKRYMNSIETIGVTIIAKTVSVALTYPYQIVRTRLHHIDGESTRIPKIVNSIWQLCVIFICLFVFLILYMFSTKQNKLKQRLWLFGILSWNACQYIANIAIYLYYLFGVRNS